MSEATRSGGRVVMVDCLLVHADWGSNPKKRWLAMASVSDGIVTAQAPEPVGDLNTFWTRMAQRADGLPVVIGFDFPIGIPAAYAARAGIRSFPDFLRDLATPEWSSFYHPASEQSEVSIRRPFYPMRPGGTSFQHLLDGLGIESRDELLRECERATASRGPASPLFWTMGGKQVGKAAIIGWRDLIAPAMQDDRVNVRLWPFDGELMDLVAEKRIVIVETYPAEACVQIGMTPPGRDWSKTDQDGRRSQAEAIKGWAAQRRVRVDEKLQCELSEGFGPRSDAEDPFDAVLGLLGMIEVVLGHRSEGTVHRDAVRRVEGWILGQSETEPSDRTKKARIAAKSIKAPRTTPSFTLSLVEKPSGYTGYLPNHDRPLSIRVVLTDDRCTVQPAARVPEMSEEDSTPRPIAPLRAEQLREAVVKLSFPPLAGGTMGLDGTTWRLSIRTRFAEFSVSWWQSLPAAWASAQPLLEILYQIAREHDLVGTYWTPGSSAAP